MKNKIFFWLLLACLAAAAGGEPSDYDLIATLSSKTKSFSKIPVVRKANPPFIPCTKSFYIRPALRDWSGYNVLSLEAENRGGAKAYLTVRAVSAPEGEKKPHAYKYEFFVKPEGSFQKFVIPFDQWKFVRKPVGWNKIDRIEFVLTPGKEQPENFLVNIRNLKLHKLSDEEIKTAKPHRLGITQEDIRKMELLIPDRCSFPIPNYHDRKFWDRFPLSSEIRKGAEKKRKSVLPEMSVSLWEAAREDKYLQGARTEWADKLKELFRVLDRCTLAECKENKGRFVPQIVGALEKLLETPWGYPDSDPAGKVISAGYRYAGLQSVITASSVLSAYMVLDDKLPEPLRARLKKRILEWTVEPVKRDLALPPGTGTARNNYGHWVMSWIDGTNNITPFTYYRVVIISNALVESKRERAELLLCAIRANENYLKNFTPEGYTPEGLSYWEMGFSASCNLALLVRELTGGKVDLSHDPHVAAITKLGWEMEMDPECTGLYPHFSDCGREGRGSLFGRLFYQTMNQLAGIDYYGGEIARKKVEYQPSSVSLFEDLRYTAAMMRKPVPLRKAPPRNPIFYVPSCGVLVSRDLPGRKEAFSFAAKGGHNQEFHNHCDLGSFVIGLGSRFYCGDPGTPVYESKTRHLVNSSVMHPVPVINGKEQGKGKKAFAKVLEMKNGPDSARISYDLKKAYPVKELTRLVRTFTHDRKNRRVLLEDDFAFSKPGVFTGCLTSYFPPEKIAENRWRFGKLDAVFRTEGKLNFETDTPRVKMRTPLPFHRLHYEFDSPRKDGKITVIFTPVQSGRN